MFLTSRGRESVEVLKTSITRTTELEREERTFISKDYRKEPQVCEVHQWNV